MPIFEYVCKSCGEKSEFLVRNSSEKLKCHCGSEDLEKILSPFAVTEGSTSSAGGCASGTCSIPQSPCASGMCGLK